MKMTKIATAKLRRTFFELIETGTKRHEVRSTSLDGVDAFYFVDSETHEPLGIFRVIDVFKIDRLDDDVAIKLAAIGQDEFYSLFPHMTRTLATAHDFLHDLSTYEGTRVSSAHAARRTRP